LDSLAFWTCTVWISITDVNY